MSYGNCEKHPFEVAQNICGQCCRPFCGECLVYSFGPKKPPFCIPCAVAAAGIRTTAANRPLAQGRERKQMQRQWRLRRRAPEPVAAVAAPAEAAAADAPPDNWSDFDWEPAPAAAD